MNLRGLASLSALLPALLGASSAWAGDVRVDLTAARSSGQLDVSWDVPEGFDESELLLEVEGGPRVRLTDELSGLSPRVRVSLPPLYGTARFVVRAGGDVEDEPEGYRERDIAFSESFDLSPLPKTQHVPVRAAASRPVRGSEMEWWADPPRRGVEGPVSGFSGHRIADGTAHDRHAPAMPPSRTQQPAARSGSPESADTGGSLTPSWSPPPRPGQPFPGSAVPLRN